MKKVSIILGHQHEGSFNHAIAELAKKTLEKNGYEVRFHDLYAEKFDALLPHEEIGGPINDPLVQQHLTEIAEADGIIIVHPNWWAMPPAIMKGWIDRVMRQGVAYRFENGAPKGLLKAEHALVFTTSNTPKEVELKWFGDPLENLWTTCILTYCGAKNVKRTNYESVIMSSAEQRTGWLADVEAQVTAAFAAE
ncbi:NAD(P)H-dependent oxidoreductase [Telmatobacter bradus]|uniref:NAD(P)H-dependent oxidoreductase n=1 Tax=Telmatobacter bradus TaxID=474953 RepID=UPI003B42B174